MITDCPTCHGLGTLGRSPDGERVYCGDCSYGVGLHLEAVSRRMDDYGVWLRDCEREGGDGSWCEDDCVPVEECLKAATALYDELSVRLDTLKQDEANRIPARLFEDL